MADWGDDTYAMQYNDPLQKNQKKFRRIKKNSVDQWQMWSKAYQYDGMWKANLIFIRTTVKHQENLSFMSKSTLNGMTVYNLTIMIDNYLLFLYEMIKLLTQYPNNLICCITSIFLLYIVYLIIKIIIK